MPCISIHHHPPYLHFVVLPTAIQIDLRGIYNILSTQNASYALKLQNTVTQTLSRTTKQSSLGYIFTPLSQYFAELVFTTITAPSLLGHVSRVTFSPHSSFQNTSSSVRLDSEHL